MKFIADFDVTEDEKRWYTNNIQEQLNLKTVDEINTIKLNLRGEKVDVDVVLEKPEKFERIRRITGYLVGTVDRWGDAKKSELHDRVKHA